MSSRHEPPAHVRRNHDDPMWSKLEVAYGYWEEIGDIDAVPSEEEAQQILDELVRLGVATEYHDTVDKVRRWFEHRRLYSPYIDEIAVERALRFDESVWRNLTARERALVVTILDEQDKLPDPHTDIVDTTPRRRREGWEQLTDRYRHRIRDAVHERRRRRARQEKVGAA